jgi:F-type H+-transporting ATPase subunit b
LSPRVSATWVTFLFEVANFLVLAAALGWFFFRPVRDALERRRSELENEQRAATEARAEAERALQDARARRAELETSLEELRERVQRDAEAERERVVEEARAQMQRERETLKGELISQRRAQARSLASDAAFAAKEIVVRLLREMGGPDLEQTLLRAACRELEKLRSSGALAPIVVESLRPLGNAELSALAQAAGVPASEAGQRIDPDLVAGVRVLTARGLVDTSAAGLAAQAERVLVNHLERENANHGGS